jgi:hypothetical protein
MPDIFDEDYLAQIALARGDPQAALDALSLVRSPIEAASLKERALRALGRKNEADAALAHLKALAAVGSPSQIARAYALRGESDLAFE